MAPGVQKYGKTPVWVPILAHTGQYGCGVLCGMVIPGGLAGDFGGKGGENGVFYRENTNFCGSLLHKYLVNGILQKAGWYDG